jgi:hypothetical protein
MMDLAGYRCGGFWASWRRSGSSVVLAIQKSRARKKVVCATVAVPQLLLALDWPCWRQGWLLQRYVDVSARMAGLEACTPTRQQPHLPTAIHKSCARPVLTTMTP